MQFESKSFLIKGNKIAWGKTLAEVETILDEKLLTPNNGWANLSIECKEAYGFPAIEFEAYAPSLDRPVMQVIYELAPSSRKRRSTHAEFWMKILEEKLGSPDNTSGYRKSIPFRSSASVYYDATWYIDDIRLHLAVFGGLRKNKAGTSAASLFIEWINEIEAAKPFMDEINILEDKLKSNSNDYANLTTFPVNAYLKPFYRPDYRLSNPDPALKNALLRRSQRALYASQLIDTPQYIRQRLNKKQIAVWEFGQKSQLAVSTLWDTVIIESKPHNNIRWTNMLPAKGGGGMYLDLDGIYISDVHSSEKLTAIVRRLEEFLGYSITCDVCDDI